MKKTVSLKLVINILFFHVIIGFTLPAFSQTFKEPYRPQFHFSPAKNWMNDPNGLVYYAGEYHMFYQHNPFENFWGHMSWGHAVSTDLIHWKQLPVAIPENGGEMIFSGSAVVDWNNTSGFGKNNEPPMVAIYTGHYGSKNLEVQSIAYSNDKGRIWTKYSGNPVIDIKQRDFRDPKVSWYQPEKKWIMVVALANEKKVHIYSSPNLKTWTLLQEFDPKLIGNSLECPDLYPLKVDTNPKNVKWVLAFSNGNHVRYTIGDFDGKTFVPIAQPEKPQKGKVLYDFEAGDYRNWTVTGDAFGNSPIAGAAAKQNTVSGFTGNKLVNSYVHGDDAFGKLVSPDFKIDSSYINFQIGGGNHPQKSYIKLIIAGKQVKEATGQNAEELIWHSWNVRPYIGKTAHIEIVDSVNGFFGHIMLDQIVQAKSEFTTTQLSTPIDYGFDHYALQSYSDIPQKDGRRISLAWMHSFSYEYPTSPWKCNMTFPCEVQLRTLNGKIKMVQNPVKEIKLLYTKRYSYKNQSIAEINKKLASIQGKMIEIVAEFEIQTGTKFGLKVRKGATEETVVYYDTNENQLVVDRSKSGNTKFSDRFNPVNVAPLLPMKGNVVKMHILLDRSSIEVYGNDGETAQTNQIYPSENSNGIEIFSEEGNVMVRSLNIAELGSMY